jgi:hypothetical protein
LFSRDDAELIGPEGVEKLCADIDVVSSNKIK